MISFANPEQLGLCLEVCHSVCADNGAFPAWKAKCPILNWDNYYAWIDTFRYHPSFDFAIIPDVIEGSELDNDRLITEWPFPSHMGVPVWHLHESLFRLRELATTWPRIALGSSGEFATVGTPKWNARMNECFAAICVNGQPICKLHGLRMLATKIFRRFPLASADSTNVARNIGIDKKWKGTYQPIDKATRAIVIARRIEAFNSAPTWKPIAAQKTFFMGVEMPERTTAA